MIYIIFDILSSFKKSIIKTGKVQKIKAKKIIMGQLHPIKEYLNVIKFINELWNIRLISY